MENYYYNNIVSSNDYLIQEIFLCLFYVFHFNIYSIKILNYVLNHITIEDKSIIKPNVLNFIKIFEKLEMKENEQFDILLLKMIRFDKEICVKSQKRFYIFNSSNIFSSKSIQKIKKESKKIAISLTKKCLQIMDYITMIELFWFIKGKKNMAPNIIKMNQIFDKITKFVSKMIIKKKTFYKQIKIINQFIIIAKECKKLGNYHLIMAIIRGLNNSLIIEIITIWKNGYSKLSKTFVNLEKLFSHQKNYFNYRQIINKQLSKNKNFVPFMSLILEDLTFIFVNIANDSICMNTIYLISNIVRPLRLYQI